LRIIARTSRAIERGAAIAREVDAIDLDRPRRRREHAEDHADGRGLARAVWTEQADDLVGADTSNDNLSTVTLAPNSRRMSVTTSGCTSGTTA